MKYIRLLLLAIFFIPAASFAATVSNNEFMVAAQLLSAAKNADIQQVQILINNGANVNYVDSTGLSLVCTALMNNDVRAAQILQMYGADASQCDRQIKQYESRTTPQSSGGLFSGLSSAQTISLAAAGAAVVVGGLFLLTDWLDPGNDNGGSSVGGDRPQNPGGGSGDNGTATAKYTIPVGPAYITSNGILDPSSSEYQTLYQSNLAQWDPTTSDTGVASIRTLDFNYFRPTEQTTNNYVTDGISVPLQNYLLIMHGYSAFANGYMGQTTFRNADTYAPIKVLNSTGGGKPILTSIITANGINPTGSAGRTTTGITWSDSASATSNTYAYDKYANFNNPSGNNLGTEIEGFDFSGSGTAMNPFASAMETAPAKIVGGWEAGGRAYGDMYGFVPNGQLAIYRTGGGGQWVDVTNPTEAASVGTLTDSGVAGTAGVINTGDTITLNGVTYTISSALDDAGVTNPTITIGDTTFKIAAGSNLLKGTCSGESCDDVSDIAIYQGTDGFYYVNTTGGNKPDAVYVISDNNIYTQKTWQDADVKNYEVLFNARTNGSAVIANASLNPDSRSISYVNVQGIKNAMSSFEDEALGFQSVINNYYDNDGDNDQGINANQLFGSYSNGSILPIIVNPAGEFAYGVGENKTTEVLSATFENYAPAVYENNLEHMFMTVVAVQNSKGTSAADSISDYGNGTGSDYGPLFLSMWQDSEGNQYMSRKCGIAGLGINGVDPWCFSAAGPTAEMATASAAGAVTALTGAFPYMNSGEIFTLMALTADGPYLATNDSGTAFTVDNLVAYLKNMYSLPPDYHADQLTGQDYLDAFAEVYGYGMINLERAMTPGKKIYFYDGSNIVSANGNAYWRAASNTLFRASSAFSPSTETISAPFFDILESVNGDMSMPRIWKNEFALGASSKRGLYMGDVLGEFKTRNDAPERMRFGQFGFSMSVSEKAYADNLNGLDNMRLDYTSGNWNFAADYQRHFTDGESRFDGMANPILGMMSNAVSSDAVYESGRWAFGGRVYSGAITDETMLDSDPTLASQYEPARLGFMQGAQSDISWQGEKFGFTSSVGAAYETNTLLGAQTGGLLDMGNGRTTYVDTEFRYSPIEDVMLKLRSTFARTVTDAQGQFILGISDINSNAFAFGVDAGNFSFSVSQPLSVSAGSLQYPYADYDIVDLGDGKYDLSVTDMHIETVDLQPEHREVRFSGAYRHNFGEFTDGAVGFIYRVNPNNTSEFGNESIFMMKMTHRLGI